MALFMAQQTVRLRAVKLNNKPQEMLSASPKGSVPILVLTARECVPPSQVLEESLEIMLWALSQNDPCDLLLCDSPNSLPSMFEFIADFEHSIIPAFGAYANAKRYHDKDELTYRRTCEVHLGQLEKRLNQHAYLFSHQESLVDIALMPFLRKFARIDKPWFRQAPYPRLQNWLEHYLQSPLFSKVMENHPIWLGNRTDVYFGEQ